MRLNKNELHILKYLPYYKTLSRCVIIFGIVNTFWYGYEVIVVRDQIKVHLQIDLLSAAIAVTGMGSLMLSCFKFIERFKAEVLEKETECNRTKLNDATHH